MKLCFEKGMPLCQVVSDVQIGIQLMERRHLCLFCGSNTKRLGKYNTESNRFEGG